MKEERMQIDTAREKLSAMQIEIENIPAMSPDPAVREYRTYLGMQITTYENVIQVFDEGQSNAG